MQDVKNHLIPFAVSTKCKKALLVEQTKMIAVPYLVFALCSRTSLLLPIYSSAFGAIERDRGENHDLRDPSKNLMGNL